MGINTAIDISKEQKNSLLSLLKIHLPNTKVWAYGSRVKYSAKPNSDLDLVAFASAKQNPNIEDLKDALVESDLPFSVDLLVWDNISEQFQTNIKAQYVELQSDEVEALPSEWRVVVLSDLTKKIGDGLHGTPKYSDDGKYYFINGNNLSQRNITFNDRTKRVNKSEFEKYKKELSDRTILVSINGTIGNVAFYNDENVVLGKSACYLNLNKNTNKGFIYYILKNNDFQSYIESFAAGTTIKNVSLKIMRDFQFNLPPLPEQKAIAHILGKLDDKIELNRQINQTLETMAQTLFKSWFVDFDPVIDNAIKAGNKIPKPLQPKADKRKTTKSTLPKDLQALFPDSFVFNDTLKKWIPGGGRLEL